MQCLPIYVLAEYVHISNKYDFNSKFNICLLLCQYDHYWNYLNDYFECKYIVIIRIKIISNYFQNS